MNRVKRSLRTASIVLAMAFTQSFAQEKGSFTDARDKKTYKTVKIGEQTWMAENLNYNAKGSECYSQYSHCNKYARMYDWITAMALDKSCNDSKCANKIQPKHRGVCPNGWHIPSNAEWDQLFRHADGNKGTETPYKSMVAGKHLKAKKGWGDDNGEVDSSCKDTYGFAALPGSTGETSEEGPYVMEPGLSGNWWTASENDSTYYNRYIFAYSRYMRHNDDGAYWSGGSDGDSKYIQLSVRCIKD